MTCVIATSVILIKQVSVWRDPLGALCQSRIWPRYSRHAQEPHGNSPSWSHYLTVLTGSVMCELTHTEPRCLQQEHWYFLLLKANKSTGKQHMVAFSQWVQRLECLANSVFVKQRWGERAALPDSCWDLSPKLSCLLQGFSNLGPDFPRYLTALSTIAWSQDSLGG